MSSALSFVNARACGESHQSYLLSMRNRTWAATAITFISSAALAAGCTNAPPKGSANDVGGSRYKSLETIPSTSAVDAQRARATHAITKVFVIVMENHNWSSIKNNPSAPYINGTLLAQGAHAEGYTSPNDVHPSEPNYVWLEAGDNLAILDDDDPGANYRTTRAHLTSQLDTASIPWKSYQEGISGTACPLSSEGLYAPKHNPMVFFDDVTDGRNPQSSHCMEHIRPYAEMARDLQTNDPTATTGYAFITPDMCNDMHNSGGCPSGDAVANGDAWLSREVPKILASKAYREGGALFIVWDENEGSPGDAIGMIVMSPFAKRGYSNAIAYTHSSLLRTVQDVFALRPYLRDAETATGLDDMFSQFP